MRRCTHIISHQDFEVALAVLFFCWFLLVSLATAAQGPGKQKAAFVPWPTVGMKGQTEGGKSDTLECLLPTYATWRWFYHHAGMGRVAEQENLFHTANGCEVMFHSHMFKSSLHFFLALPLRSYIVVALLCYHVELPCVCGYRSNLFSSRLLSSSAVLLSATSLFSASLRSCQNGMGIGHEGGGSVWMLSQHHMPYSKKLLTLSQHLFHL